MAASLLRLSSATAKCTSGTRYCSPIGATTLEASRRFATSVGLRCVQMMCRSSEGRLSMGHSIGVVASGRVHDERSMAIDDIEYYQSGSQVDAKDVLMAEGRVRAKRV